ncbi:MAG: Ig-like domain-containing protein, partial [Firmicutes bacterium]|nr:Ig-like domain-containing protein [Bacillota bacterium]
YHAPFKAVAAGDNHSLALDTDGRLWVWGASLSLQLTSVAVGSTIATPTRVNVDTTFSAISAGYGFALAIDATNNRLHAWGSNSDGQLGMGSGRPETQFKAIAAGVSTSMGISTSGGLYVWGFNGEDSWGFDGESSNLGGGGFLGDGTTTNRRSPTRIMSPTQFKYIANGGSHKLAICIDGYLFAWGSNFAGQLGDWSNTDRRTPTQITNALRFQQVTAGINHSMALCVNYNLWAFGDNSFGQLGDGTQSNRRTPTPIMSGTRFSAVSSGGSFTIALQKAAPPVVLPDPTVTITAEDNHLLIPYQQVDQPPIVMPTLQLSAHITGLEQGNIQKVWSVSNSQVASINQNGLLTAVGAGEAVVTLTLNQNFTATFAIYITQEDPPDEYYYCYFGCCYDGYVYLPGIGMPGIDPDVCLCECYYCGDDCYYCDDNCYFCEYCNYNCCDNGGDNGGGIIGPPPDTNIGGGTIQQNNRITDLDETTQMIIAISAGGGVGLGLIIVVRIARAIRLRRPFKDF